MYLKAFNPKNAFIDVGLFFENRQEARKLGLLPAGKSFEAVCERLEQQERKERVFKGQPDIDDFNCIIWVNKVWLMVIGLFLGVMTITWAEPSHSISQVSMPPVFDTVDWANTRMPGRLIIRTGLNGKTIFLTMRDELEKGNRHRAVYEYGPKAQSLRKVSGLKWDELTSVITECFAQSQQFPEKFKVNGEKLFFGNREVPIKGTVLLSSAYSPSGNAVAILSADGPRKGSGMPFLGGGQNSKGQHYHQLFSVATGKPLSAALKLPFTTEHQAYPACWSIDEIYVFYTSLVADKLTIVKTGLSNK